ncbi:putative endonuclease/exonuclease/phosphatase [Rosa chinensis]|uniref:Putative endonuclease/exonuclease/phosphatase n=1 Tax=Rosa chinensis TaxID=74649 RepID=A0A2P6Q6B7_ROSCH|nr:putative endonuclease/exonuclease/phosphatase [Rosa chinensis]
MNLLFRNCRGICNPSTRRALKILISQHKPKLVFLIETKIRDEDEFERLRCNLGFDHAEGVMSAGLAGGLGLFWYDDMKVQIRQPSTARFIDIVVEEGGGLMRWRFTGFYGNPEAAARHESWDILRALSDDDSLPWVVLGDFNEILLASEKLDGRPRSENQMRGFRDALGYAELVDLGFHGCSYTWSDSETKVRLDRVVATAAWFGSFIYLRASQTIFHSCSVLVQFLLSRSRNTIGFGLNHSG